MYFQSKIRIYLLVILFQLPVVRLFAQSSAEDSISFLKAVNNALAIYYRSAGDQSRIYNGVPYTGYPFVFAEGYPFFLTDKVQKGSIIYDRVEYQGIDLLYDELKGAVIIKDENHRIQLSNDRISAFTIGNYRFVRIVQDSINKAAPATGFYNILYEGNLYVLKKEIKTIREIISFSTEEKTRVIDLKTDYYIKNNNEYSQINNQKELVNYFPQRKKEIQHYIKNNRLNFKKNPDSLFVKVAAYYDQLKK